MKRFMGMGIILLALLLGALSTSVFLSNNFSLAEAQGIEQTATGFYWPTGTSNIGTFAGWLDNNCDWDPPDEYTTDLNGVDYYHIGWDIAANVDDPVYAISDGEIVYISGPLATSGWGAGNYAIIVKHTLADGSQFLAVYGHVIPIDPSLQFSGSGPVTPPISINGGDVIANIGPLAAPHLHFGIRDDITIQSPFGNMPCPSIGPITNTNEFVDPIDWITTNHPLNGSSSVTNGSFETGDLSGWNVVIPPNGFSDAVTDDLGQPSDGFDTFRYYPPDGNYFALLKTDGPGSYATLSQTFNVPLGSKITGCAFFNAQDYLPYDDNAQVTIQGSTGAVVATVFSASVGTLGNYGQTPWTYWEYTTPATGSGTFTLEARIANAGDDILDSYMGLDAINSANTGICEVLGEIQGIKWDDLDGDGVQDPGEPTLPNVQVCAFKLVPPDTVGQQIGCTQTDSAGNYALTNLAQGYYRIAETPVPGFSQTFPPAGAPHYITLAQGEVVQNQDFGNHQTPPGTISGTKWNDLNGDGIRDPGEPGIQAIQICINPLYQCVSTDAQGNFQVDVSPGTYQVYEPNTFGMTNTTPISQIVTVVSGQASAGVDFGNMVPTPPPPEVSVIGQTPWMSNGLPTVNWGNSTTYQKDVTNHCGAQQPLQVKLLIKMPETGGQFEQMMTQVGPGEIWEATFPPFYPQHGTSKLTFYVDCPPDTANFPEDLTDADGDGQPDLMSPEDEIQNGGSIYVDPSGTILDSCTGLPLQGATVTLLKESPPSSGNFVVPSASDHIPADNPQVTGADGSYGWVAVPGTYKVQAQKTGYNTTETAPVVIPPAVTNLDISLDLIGVCNQPPTADAGPDQTVASTNSAGAAVTLDGTLSSDPDSDPLSFAWSAPGVSFDDLTSPTPTGTFPVGATTVTLVVNDGTVDSAPDTVDITVLDSSTCPDDVLISNYQVAPSSNQFVEVANVGNSPISLGGCSLVTFNVFTEQSIGAASVGLSGILFPGDTTSVNFIGALPAGPAAIGIYDGLPPADGSPFSTANEITGMVYQDNDTVFGVSHLTVPAHNAFYDCIYGGSGQGPFNGPFQPLSSCFP